jgi:hypothetical protein
MGSGTTPTVGPGMSEADQGGPPPIGLALWPACQSCWKTLAPVGRIAATSFS